MTERITCLPCFLFLRIPK